MNNFSFTALNKKALYYFDDETLYYGKNIPKEVRPIFKKGTVLTILFVEKITSRSQYQFTVSGTTSNNERVTIPVYVPVVCLMDFFSMFQTGIRFL